MKSAKHLLLLLSLVTFTFSQSDRLLEESKDEEDEENKDLGPEIINNVEQIDIGVDKNMKDNVEKFLLEQEMEDLRIKQEHANRPESTCNDELIHSYRLFPRKDITDDQVNFICPYIKGKDDCCQKNSQNMIQILWGRISKPRLERELTYHLEAIETIINDMKDVMKLFVEGELPQHTEYSAECLDSVNKMSQLHEENFFDSMDYMYNYIKVAFERLFKFKKSFYCFVCDRRNHEYVKVFDKQLIMSNSFCQSLSTDYKDLVYFLNFQLIKQFQTIRNFVLCYREKNYLLVKDVYKFKFDKVEMKKITDCMFENQCSDFCGEYSLTLLKEFFIGKREWLDQMRKFMEANKVDDQGFFDEADVEKEDETVKEHEVEEEMKKMEFFKPENRTVDQVQWDFWREMFDISKEKMTQKKMASIKRKMKREFDEDMVFQNFINMNKAKIRLDVFNLRNDDYGINLYDHLDMEELYKTNSQLTFFMKPLNNTVGDLLNLDETVILKQMVTVSKYIKDKEQPKDMVKYIESKIFDMDKAKSNHLIKDPYIQDISVARLYVPAIILCLIWFN
jgi:hypothetical protein